MILFKNQQLVYIDSSEDNTSGDAIITAVKTLEECQKERYSEYVVTSKEFTLAAPNKVYDNKHYLFRMTKSPYSDNSGIGDGFNGAFETKGEAIAAMQRDGFTVYQNGKELTKLKKPEKVIMSFKDAPIGARFHFINNDKQPKPVYIKIHDRDDGLIVQWNGNIKGLQAHCCWVDNIHDFDTLIELI